MPATADGWYEFHVPGAAAGTRYRFHIDDEIDVPDPASAFQPEDVLGPSEVIDHAYDWQATEWRGRPWHEAAILELHVGTFTPAGTFRAAIERLGDVAAAGFTAIELMPLADFPGRWNWGYDGVLLFAPDSSYGRPEDLKALIDAAHRHGLMVLLDVVYNHFGPEGNFLARYAPSVFTTEHHTPWGAAIDYRVAEVRDFAVANALHWLDRYRFDGLRLDAVHAIAEPGPLLAALSHAVGALAERTDRAIHLVLENDDNCASLLDPATDPPAGGYRAQWNDDYHHVWHALLTDESFGYYRDYSQQPGRHLARALSAGFVYQGEPSPHRNGRRRGERSGALPPTAFVNFLQNHDQIGNRARGERLTVLTTPERLEAALAITLLAPMPPLMFMGEEWGATQPFPFFCDFTGDLAEAVRCGRRAEFADAYAQARPDDPIPDPLAEDTFRSAVLDWSTRRAGPHHRRLRLVRQLLMLRRRAVVPRLAGLDHAEAAARWDDGVLTAHWRLGGPARLNLLANLGDMARPRPPLTRATRSLWGGSPPPELPPWSVFWSIGGD
jgi:malto-oligosyltrehalose trehalohydrolase